MEKVIKIKEINNKYNNLVKEAEETLTTLAREEFKVNEEETHNKDYFFGSKCYGDEYYLFNGLTMIGGIPHVKGIVWCGLNMHIEKVIPICWR